MRPAAMVVSPTCKSHTSYSEGNITIVVTHFEGACACLLSVHKFQDDHENCGHWRSCLHVGPGDWRMADDRAVYKITESEAKNMIAQMVFYIKTSKVTVA